MTTSKKIFILVSLTIALTLVGAFSMNHWLLQTSSSYVYIVGSMFWAPGDLYESLASHKIDPIPSQRAVFQFRHKYAGRHAVLLTGVFGEQCNLLSGREWPGISVSVEISQNGLKSGPHTIELDEKVHAWGRGQVFKYLYRWYAPAHWKIGVDTVLEMELNQSDMAYWEHCGPLRIEVRRVSSM